MAVLLQRLGEDVGNIGVGRNVPNLKFVGLSQVADEVIADVDVFGPRMKDTSIRSEGDSTLVVTPESGLFLRMPELGEK